MLVLKTKRQRFEQLAFSPDGKAIAVGGPLGAYVWPSPDGNRVAEEVDNANVGGLRFALDGRWLVTSTPRRGVQVLDLHSRAKHAILVGEFNAAPVAVSPCGTLLLTVSYDAKAVLAWRVDESSPPQRL